MKTDLLPEDYPKLFPLLKDCTYLDTGSAGVSCASHARAAARFYEDKTAGYLGREQWQARAAAVRARLGEWLSVAPEEIEFFSGTTDALNIVAHSIEWRAGDELVVAADEFPSVRLAWGAAERAGVTIREVQIPSEAKREDALIAALGPRTRAVAAAHVHSATGTRLDLDRVGRACRERGCLFVVDGIHALGATPVHLGQVDVYMSGIFKWLLAGFGLSICIVRERARSQMRPAFRGYLNPPPQQALQFAHINYPGVYALEASLELLGDTVGWSTVHARTEQLVSCLADSLADIGLELAAPAGARAGIASFAVPDAEEMRTRLAQKRIHVAAKGRYVRATPFFYNSTQDIEKLVAAVRTSLRP